MHIPVSRRKDEEGARLFETAQAISEFVDTHINDAQAWGKHSFGRQPAAGFHKWPDRIIAVTRGHLFHH
jgi:hypothetical protein